MGGSCLLRRVNRSRWTAVLSAALKWLDDDLLFRDGLWLGTLHRHAASSRPSHFLEGLVVYICLDHRLDCGILVDYFLCYFPAVEDDKAPWTPDAQDYHRFNGPCLSRYKN
jgi:hypothetical protein